MSQNSNIIQLSSVIKALFSHRYVLCHCMFYVEKSQLMTFMADFTLSLFVHIIFIEWPIECSGCAIWEWHYHNQAVDIGSCLTLNKLEKKNPLLLQEWNHLKCWAVHVGLSASPGSTAQSALWARRVRNERGRNAGTLTSNNNIHIKDRR